MYVSSSAHEIPLDPYRNIQPLRFNAPLLLNLLKASPIEPLRVVTKGKKRARTPESLSGEPPAKRAKTNLGGALKQEAGITVFQHSLKIRYRVGGGTVPSEYYEDSDTESIIIVEDNSMHATQTQDLGKLLDWLRRKFEMNEDEGDIALERLHLVESSGRYFLATEAPYLTSSLSIRSRSIPTPESTFLLELPSFRDDPHNFFSYPHGLQACIHLLRLGYVKITTLATVTLDSPSSPSLQGLLPFSMSIIMEVALNLSAWNGLNSVRTKAEVAKLHDTQHQILLFAFPPSKIIETHNIEPHIPFFYSVLGPAPPLPTLAAEEAMQPVELLPILLPFQRRSVGWLLEREGKVISPNGEVISRDSGDDLPLFWQKAQTQTGERVYVNRVTMAVTLQPPRHQNTLGGILAEEPGLGKTLEAIALVLLNPAIGRNPTTKRWDANAKVYVKEIKTTLIVTPAALAPQWADELRLHAPSLKVLIYNGWSKVTVPISEDDVEEEREIRKQSKAKAKAKAKSKSKFTSRSKPSTRAKITSNGPLDSSVSSSSANATKEDNLVDEHSDNDDSDHDDDDDAVLDWCAYVQTFDVCITTYNVLQQDLGVARAPPTRPRRNIAQYSNIERPRSPLIMCEWYRVIMDEVQMVGGGKTEEMVSLIPRLSSFAVSGTPARAQVSDLIHVLKFLRVDTVLNVSGTWPRLLTPRHAPQFQELFQKYAIRTIKASVKEELTIPQQTRYLVPVDLGRVERQVYDETLERALNELGLDARGVAASDGWEIDNGLLRSWLRKLRGIATHPQVGQLLNPTDKLNKSGVIKSIQELLEGMCDLNWRTGMDDRKKRIESFTRSAQLQQHEEGNPRRYQRALELLLLAEQELNRVFEDISSAITMHDARGEKLKEEAVALRIEQVKAVDVEDESGKNKQRAVIEDKESSLNLDEDGDEYAAGIPKTRAGAEHILKRVTLVKRLRDCNLVLHKVKFLQGDVYHVLGTSYSDAEDAAYAAAERLRRDLLKHAEISALRSMEKLARELAGKVSEKEMLVPLPYCDEGGVRSAFLMEEANDMIKNLLNSQTTLLWEWRRRIYDLLTEKISTEDQDATGGEYAQSLETQGQAEVLLQAYAALMADRREVLIAERTTLAAYDDVRKQKGKGRKTKAAGKAQAALESILLNDPGASEELQQLAPFEPEHQVLAKELADERRNLMEQFDGRAIKSIMIELSEVLGRITKDEDPEKELVKDACHRLRMLINQQNISMDVIENDLARLRRAFNERILYFRQLQEISDSVIDVEWEGEIALALETEAAEQVGLEIKINSNRARQRYLENLAQGKQEGNQASHSSEDDVCILCHCDFHRGYMTQCAHAFCEGCMKAFLGRRDGKACPVCRAPINVDQLQRFSIGDHNSGNAPEKVLNADGEVVPKSQRQIEYNFIEPQVLKEIISIEVYGGYGSKIEAIVRHLLYIQHYDPGAKSIIFSAWADSLHIVQHALVNNGIPCIRIDQSSGGKENAAKRFRTDPGIFVLLLHGERENAGLNVTCASRVFLVESVVNHAFETQAIARVDRMGQRRPTEVFCYYAEDTIERNILDLAARQGLSLYTKDNSAGTLTSITISESQTLTGSPSKKAKVAKQKGDFIFSVDDMLAILFPHMYEELEYLLPRDSTNGQRSSLGKHAEAGPSRVV